LSSDRLAVGRPCPVPCISPWHFTLGSDSIRISWYRYALCFLCTFPSVSGFVSPSPTRFIDCFLSLLPPLAVRIQELSAPEYICNLSPPPSQHRYIHISLSPYLYTCPYVTLSLSHALVTHTHRLPDSAASCVAHYPACLSCFAYLSYFEMLSRRSTWKSGKH
jgi:hypothetical protein